MGVRSMPVRASGQTAEGNAPGRPLARPRWPFHTHPPAAWPWLWITVCVGWAISSGLAEAQVTTTVGQSPEGGTVTIYRFPCPRFINGADSPVDFGGCFVETTLTLEALQRLLRRPDELRLPFGYSGFITDALEGAYPSYDATTLAEFARRNGLDPALVTPASVNGQHRRQWAAYNNELYAAVAAGLAEALREVKPQIAMLNTAGPFGAQHGADDLPLAERQLWARTYDYSMPQWYSLRYFGSLYTDTIGEGMAAGVYGREKGYADLIPLLCNSMGVQTESLACIRFKVFDLLSTASVVKGVGYYIGTNAFADARWMVGISEVHTLLADVEEYYVDGRRADALVRCEKLAEGVKPITGLDEAGQQAMLVPKVETACRVHALNQQGRRALITLVSHRNQGVGETMRLTLDLGALAPTPDSFVYDHLAGRRLPLAPTLTVDTNASGNLALLEIGEVTPPR